MSDDYERVKKWCADPRSMPCAPYNSICRVFEDYERLRDTLKTAEELAVKHAQEAGRLAAELDALRKQEPVAEGPWMITVESSEVYSPSGDKWKEIVAATPAPVEASHPNCNYRGWLGRVCTKCGEVHNEVPPQYLFGKPDADAAQAKEGKP